MDYIQKLVKQFADPLIEQGLSPDAINIVLAKELGIMIGSGSKGPWEHIPKCPYCGAHGGGGHGGFCPNAR